MKEFMDKDFLLDTETAKKLYHEHAEKMPIIDYHCPKRFTRTRNSEILPKYGSAQATDTAITTSGEH